MSGKTRWVFAYGSLIWNPGFDYLRAEPARLDGYHRALCVLSHRYRGTPEKLGLVFGLDRGGSCHGLAYEIDDRLWPAVYRYLTERELITHIYIEKHLPVTLGGSARQVEAMTYVVDAAHSQYAGPITHDQILAYVRQGVGEAGSCVDYVRNTARHLHELGIPDPELDELVHLI
jgi:glutathione-specific gamma-glutamylcyclotransferase